MHQLVCLVNDFVLCRVVVRMIESDNKIHIRFIRILKKDVDLWERMLITTTYISCLVGLDNLFLVRV